MAQKSRRAQHRAEPARRDAPQLDGRRPGHAITTAYTNAVPHRSARKLDRRDELAGDDRGSETGAVSRNSSRPVRDSSLTIRMVRAAGRAPERPEDEGLAEREAQRDVDVAAPLRR